MPKKRKKITSHTISNRRASHHYTLSDNLIVGIKLIGAEVKSLRLGHGDLKGAYVTLKNNELWLINATIHGTKGIIITDSDKTRARKILARRQEINKLIEAKQTGKTIIPIEILTKEKFIKLKIALGKGKKNYDKRQLLKRRDQMKSINIELKRKIQN